MNKEKQRIAIAEACGWTRCRDVGEDPMGSPPDHYGIFDVVPDYLNDLNAMHEAEKTLKSKSISPTSYASKLQHVCGGDRNVFDESTVFASAAQRAEAFLKTIGKWES